MRLVVVLLLCACGRFGFGLGDDEPGTSGDDGGSGSALDDSGLVGLDSMFTGMNQASANASNAGGTDNFGHGVAMSADGNVIVVGAQREDSNATGVDGNQGANNAQDAGAAYVFERIAGTWQQTAYLKASNTNALDMFGWRVAISGDGATVAVSAIDEASNATGVGGDQTNNSMSSAGAVYVFVRSGTTWTQQAYVKASNTGMIDQFGFFLDLSHDGNTLAVGAVGEASGVVGNQADNSVSGAGAVYMFTRSGTTWTQQAYLKASNPGLGDAFGWSLSLSGSGDRLAVGAPSEASNATGIDGNGADNSMPGAGAAYVFSRSGSTWTQEAYVKASDTAAMSELGYTIALSNDGAMLAVGSPQRGTRTGAAYVFSRVGTTWSQQQRIVPQNGNADDQFGWSVAIDGDGDTLVVGAPYEDGNGTGLTGDPTNNSTADAGAFYVYTRGGATWTQSVYAKSLAPLPGDLFGYAIGISADSSRIACAAAFADGAGADSGVLYIFD